MCKHCNGQSQEASYFLCLSGLYCTTASEYRKNPSVAVKGNQEIMANVTQLLEKLPGKAG